MSTESPETLRCPICGASGQALLADGLCARCLLGVALDLPGEHAAEQPVRIGRYRVLDEIAQGGVGVVHRAWQDDLCREVAIKTLLPARLEAAGARDRFRREAELMAGLDHPGILPVYEVGFDDGRPYFSMKLAEGGNLAERARMLRGKFRDIARVVADIARAIAHAHARGVLHRDLKPSNIVFDADGRPLVTDFGLARLLARESSLTGVDALIGTPRYVAPEVVTSPATHLTVAADVYGLGAILYELLTGQAPFAELTSLQVLQQVAKRRPRAPRQVDPAIPAELEAICLRCLEKRPRDRHASAGAVAKALDAWLDSANPSLTSRLRLSLLALPSRRRCAAAGGAIALIVAIAAAAYVLATRVPTTIPDPRVAMQSVSVLPNRLKDDRDEADSARMLVAELRLPPPFRVVPFDESLAVAKRSRSSSDADLDAALGAFIAVTTSKQPDGRYALGIFDDLREEGLYETSYAAGEEARVARDIAARIIEKRSTPTAESRLSRRGLAALIRSIGLLQNPGEGTNAAATTALEAVIREMPDSAVALAWLAYAYATHGHEVFWLDSAIDLAARAERIDPTLGLATKVRGLAYQAKGWHAREIEALEKARALGALELENPLGWLYFITGRFVDAYRMSIERRRFGTDDRFPDELAAETLLSVGENDAGERALRHLIDEEPDADRRTLHEAELAWYRDDYARCRELLATIGDDIGDGYFTASTLARNCAIATGDYAAPLATMDAAMHEFATNPDASNGNNPALRKAILLAAAGRNEEVPALVEQARRTLQAAVDGNVDYPPVWLRLAAVERLAGDIDAAYATLEHAFALGFTINRRNRGDVELLPFRDDARFAALRAKSEAGVAAQRPAIAALVASDPAFAPPAPGRGTPPSL
jgi:serine/threonine protein kinase/tetratricopeptide (TPR) repeat protein